MKRGFTLIELLAVIVILAIIALIAVPVILNIIGDSKEKATLTSAKNYTKAVEQAIADYALNNPGAEINLEHCEGKTSEPLTCYNVDGTSFHIEAEVGGEKPEYANIVFNKGKIKNAVLAYESKSVKKDNGGYKIVDSELTLELDNATATKDAITVPYIVNATLGVNQSSCEYGTSENYGSIGIIQNNTCELSSLDSDTTYYYKVKIIDNADNIIEKQGSIKTEQWGITLADCIFIDGTYGNEGEVGAKYSCEVKSGTIYDFYILSKKANKANLIMERNICDDGTVATSSNPCIVSWNENNTNTSGPITAMTYAYDATKNWNNIPNIKMDYKDEKYSWNGDGSYIPIKGASSMGYNSIKTIDNITKIYDYNNEETISFSKLKARLPYMEELLDVGCRQTDGTNGSCPYWLHNYLYDPYIFHPIDISGICGYLTLSSGGYYYGYHAFAVTYYGTVEVIGVKDNGSLNGVRPVIELPIS